MDESLTFNQVRTINFDQYIALSTAETPAFNNPFTYSTFLESSVELEINKQAHWYRPTGIYSTV
jgi:hypothetical protein